MSPKSANDALARVESPLSEALQSALLLRDVRVQHEQAHVQFETYEPSTRFLRASALRSNKTALIKVGDSKTTPDEATRDADRSKAESNSRTGRKRSASHMSSSSVTQPTNNSRTLSSSKARVAKQEAPSKVLRARTTVINDKPKRSNRVAAKSVSSKQVHQNVVPDENVAPSDAQQPSKARDEDDWLFGDEGF